MSIVAVYGLAGSDPGILATAFPGVQVFRDPHFPPFVTDERIIVFSDDEDFAKYPDKDVVLIHPDASVRLDTREGFLRFLGTLGTRASNAQVETLLEMEDGDFWREAKQATILKCFPNISHQKEQRKKGAMYRLYDVLFDDFGASFREYSLLRDFHGASPMSVGSGLLTMTLKARTAHRNGALTPYYKKMLLKNRPFEPIFKRAMLEFLDTDRLERDFLTFLLYCAEREPGDGADRFLGL